MNNNSTAQPPLTPEELALKERRRESARRRVQAYRDRYPERAREARRKSDAKRRGKPGWKPKPKLEVPRCKTTEEEAKRQTRVSMIRARMEYLKKKAASTQ
jgi:hypothetical protein